ncbi:hypothetical protein AAFF_G00419060 [Aldrovandia affinis]|uniref:Reverse transcriptase zinc-binding domain-containing protein n=1 Tax=Aldrovandia affinis TaxID=143900 RepID=A0AAD7SA25_9TELE|nr:hypothetical protein AAFF_G00419060 [Aldrovandia affinis]
MQRDVFLLQEVHLRDMSAFTREWVWGPSGWLVGGVHSDGVGILFCGFSFVVEEVGGRRLEVIRELPGCLSTSRSLILGDLGRPFFARDSAALNWEARFNLVRTRLGVWTRRQLTGRVHLAYVFPVPARTKLALTRLVFRFLWGGRIFLERAPHRCYYFARFYLAGFFRHLVALSHVVPRSETPSPGYRSVIRFLHQCPSPITREEATDHRACTPGWRPGRSSGVPAGVVWSRVSGGRAPGAVRDLQWRCALGRLPHRHGCAASPLCTRGCGAPETVLHVFWDCPYAREFWTLVQGLLRRVGPGHVLSRDGVVYRRGLGFLPSVTSGVLWDLLGYAKLVLWEARMAVVVPVGLSPELFSSPSGTVAAGSGEGVMSPSMEGAALSTTSDLATPHVEWGNSSMDEEESGEQWEKSKPTRKRALSGGHECPRGHESAPAVPLSNRFEALAGTVGDEDNGERELGIDMDLLSSSPGPWVPEIDYEEIETDLRTPIPPGEEDLGEEEPP